MRSDPSGADDAPGLGAHPSISIGFETPRRLHPASILVGISAGQLIRGVVIPLFAAMAAEGLSFLLVLGVLAVIFLVARVLVWQRRYYSFDGQVLRIDGGVVSRSHRSLDVDRIQQIEIQRGFVQRVLTLATVRVETAGSATEAEVELRVVSEAEAQGLRDAVRAQKARRPSDGVDATSRGMGGALADTSGTDGPRRILAIPAGHIVLASVTGARLLVFPAFVAAGFQLLGEAVSQYAEEAAAQLQRLEGSVDPLAFSGPNWGWIFLLFLAVLFVSVASAAILGLLRDGRFRIEQVGDDLQISKGLLSTRESVVPLSRVQLVTVQQNWLRRLLGFASVQLRSAGGSTGGAGSVTVPLLPTSGIDELLREILSGFKGLPELTPHPRPALRRTLFRRLRLAALMIALAWIAPWLLDGMDPTLAARIGWGSLLLVPLAAGLALLEYRHLGHALTDSVVVSRRGALSISTVLGPRRKVQAVTGMAGPFQRRLGLASLIAHVAGPGAVLTIQDASTSQEEHLHARLVRSAAGE